MGKGEAGGPGYGKALFSSAIKRINHLTRLSWPVVVNLPVIRPLKRYCYHMLLPETHISPAPP